MGNEGRLTMAMIREGRTTMGMELGSTRIKAVLIDENHRPIVTGGHNWENRLEGGIWTYALEDVWTGIQDTYQDTVENVLRQYREMLMTIGAVDFNAMMHGYMVLDKAGKLLVSLRTWRNTITGEASERLTEVFQYPVPQRWSISYLYQAILNRKPHVPDIDYMVTLEGYVHWMLTGRKVPGIGDIAGMFPVDVQAKDFHQRMVEQFDQLVAGEKLPWKLRDILPKALVAGEDAGVLTEEGAKLLDTSGNLKARIPLCPPEGDAGTGMTATNSVAVRTGNVSVGTSVFAMVVPEKELKKVHPEIDLATTPVGDLVGMAHCNNCTSDLNVWVGIFKEFVESMGMDVGMNELFGTLYRKAPEGDANCGGLLSYNYSSGEHITGFEEGRPLFVRRPDSRLTLANFVRTHLYTSLGALETGLDILFKEEDVKLDVLLGHGGLFKTKGVGQRIMAAVVDAPVSVVGTAGEGGTWGVALLAEYMLKKEDGETLAGYPAKEMFAGQEGSTLQPEEAGVAGFEVSMERYRQGLPVEQAAVEVL